MSVFDALGAMTQWIEAIMPCGVKFCVKKIVDKKKVWLLIHAWIMKAVSTGEFDGVKKTTGKHELVKADWFFVVKQTKYKYKLL